MNVQQVFTIVMAMLLAIILVGHLAAHVTLDLLAMASPALVSN